MKQIIFLNETKINLIKDFRSQSSPLSETLTIGQKQPMSHSLWLILFILSVTATQSEYLFVIVISLINSLTPEVYLPAT